MRAKIYIFNKNNQIHAFLQAFFVACRITCCSEDFILPFHAGYICWKWLEWMENMYTYLIIEQNIIGRVCLIKKNRTIK